MRLRLEDQLEIQKVFWRLDTYLAACTKHAEYMNMIEHVHATSFGKLSMPLVLGQ